MWHRVRFHALLSTLVLVIVGATTARAHEVVPGVADVTFSADALDWEISLNLEALVAGIDLQGVTNTNETDQSDVYDSLRALPPTDLEAAFRDVWPSLQSGFIIQIDETIILPELENVVIPEIGNLEVPRETKLLLSAVLPTDGSAVSVGWAAEYGVLILRQQGVETEAYTGFLSGGELSPPIPRDGGLTQTAWQTIWDYLVHGFEHIIPKGLDHILFVLGLFFLSLQLRPLITQVTAFTLAHTITLALGITGVVNIPGSIVEPLIALSIVYVAVENIISPKMTPWRPVIVVLFGLLHGLGFASVLGDVGLPDGQFAISLIAFNIGVEIGQLTVIAVAFLAVGLWFGKKDWYRPVIAIPASLAIAVIGAWWSFERVFL
jgi:hypothetical protein